jgi:hypothetical protein
MTIGVALMGGLGNQIFQFAFYNHLRLSGLPVEYLVEDFKNDGFGRTNLLFDLGFPAQLVDMQEFIDTQQGEIIVLSDFTLNNYTLTTIKELTLTNTLLFKGYWQHIDTLIASSIETIFDVKSYIFSEAIAIHVRRQDYSHHGVLPRAYYESIISSFEGVPFIAYTDEPNVVNHAFSQYSNFLGVSRDLPKLLGLNHRLKIIDELLLLASHKTIVMANSSFSWIAAYLAHVIRNADIYYPKSWCSFYSPPVVCKPEWRNWKGIDIDLITF